MAKSLRVDLLIQALGLIATTRGVASPRLCALLGVTRTTVTRLFLDAEDHLGVQVRWRLDNTLPSNGEYVITNWGGLNREWVLAHAKTSG